MLSKVEKLFGAANECLVQGQTPKARQIFIEISEMYVEAAKDAQSEVLHDDCMQKAAKFLKLAKHYSATAEEPHLRDPESFEGSESSIYGKSTFVKRHFERANQLIVYGKKCQANDDEEGQYEFFSDAIFELNECIAASADQKQRRQFEGLIAEISKSMPGLDVEAEQILRQWQQYEEEMPQNTTQDDNQHLIIDRAVEPAQQDDFEVITSTVTFNDVKGLESAKEALSEAAILPKRFPQLFKGRETWRSILLYGVPGTGKTFLAKALAGELKSTFISVNPSDIFSKYQGDSERSVRRLFEQARRNAPAVIFIDEVDSILSNRGGNDDDSSKRVKAEFLTQIQGVDSKNSDVLLIAATNYPEMLDHAVLRRLEKRIVVQLPDAEARRGIIEAQLQGIPNKVLDTEMRDLDALIEGYSSSDLVSLLKEAIMEPIREMECCQYFRLLEDGFYEPCASDEPNATKMTLFEIPDQHEVREPPVSIAHLKKALETMKKTVTTADIDRIGRFMAEYGG